jgi:hypothetical protein
MTAEQALLLESDKAVMLTRQARRSLTDACSTT